jgi:hypothetical protein
MNYKPISKTKAVTLFIGLLGLLLPGGAKAQVPIENSVFWEIRGNGLTEPSYLFGTFHLMGSGYIDSLTNVLDKFSNSENVVGELLLDSAMTVRMIASAQLHDTTLDKLLDSTLYHQTSSWLRELSGYDLRVFNSMNPMTIQILIMTMLQQKLLPINQVREMPMDMYFQVRAKKEGKRLLGLESFEVQVHALFNQFTVQRQAEMLADFVQHKSKAESELLSMNKYYRAGDLARLEELLTTQSYSREEAEIMLDNRNKNWIEHIPDLLHDGPTFIAVGALHLAGENGLVTLFRNAGYTMLPVSTK